MKYSALKTRRIKFAAWLLTLPAFFLMLSCESLNEELDLAKSSSAPAADASGVKLNGKVDINVLLSQPVTDDLLAELEVYGMVKQVIPEINALTMKADGASLTEIQNLPFVDAANPDAVREKGPVDAVSVEDFSEGINTWNLDAVNVTDFGQGRTVEQDGTNVFIGVLDTGLSDDWRQFFPEERIAVQYAKSFGGGGGERGNVSEQPNKWEHDQDSHGTHVTSTIIGFDLRGTAINGVAPLATIVPVKVLNQNGSGWSSVVAQGIVYMASLKAGPLSDHPVIINMSLGGSRLDAIEKAAIDYAIEQGVILVASAGNSGEAGMGYPGAYKPVISVASIGWEEEFTAPGWWTSLDVPDPTDVSEYYVSDFSSRSISEEQDLDVAAPGSYIVGPYQVNSGQLSYYYLSGTSMACPHVAGIVALMAEQNPALTAADAEMYLEAAAIPMASEEETGAGFITADAALGEVM